jgi:hypothetical protein
MNGKIAILACIFNTAVLAEPHNFKTVEGGALYLLRAGTETHRAEFENSEDCAYIAKIMSEKEPAVKWYCSTSATPIEYHCNFTNITIKNEKNEATSISTEIKIRMDRGKAASFAQELNINTFDYEKTDKYLMLTSDYPYASGNYITSAIYKIKINIKNKKAEILNIDLDTNGTGSCKKIGS